MKTLALIPAFAALALLGCQQKETAAEAGQAAATEHQKTYRDAAPFWMYIKPLGYDRFKLYSIPYSNVPDRNGEGC